MRSPIAVNLHILLLAAGDGLRLGSTDPKQFLMIAGKPILFYSLNTFLKWRPAANIVIVVAEKYLSYTKGLLDNLLPDHIEIEIANQHQERPVAARDAHQNRSEREPSQTTSRTISIIAGDKSRHASCLKGMQFILSRAGERDHLLIHDAARPLLCLDELERLYTILKKNEDCAISLAMRLSETVAESDDWHRPVERFLSRERIFALKTPQAISISTLQKILQRQEDLNKNFTDLLTWAKTYGVKSLLAKADAFNIKLTYPGDLILLESLLRDEP